MIEKSNLSRQFLFRDWNIGQAKSTVAASAAAAINPSFNIEALQNRVGTETENCSGRGNLFGADQKGAPVLVAASSGKV